MQGGARYYSVSGNYLGKVGDTDEIRIVDSCYYNASNPDKELLIERSNPFSTSSGSYRAQVLEDVVQRFDKSGSGAIVVLGSGSVASFDGIGIYLNSNSFFYNNVADILIAIAHEMSHRNNPVLKDDSEYEIAQKEYNANWVAKNSSYFRQASSTARQHIEFEISRQWKIMQDNK